MYQLTAEDLDDRDYIDTPVIRAAAKPNLARLEALLARYAASNREQNLSRWKRLPIDRLSPNCTVNIDGRIQSPLNAAIGANLPDNVRLLLAAGADPNGIEACDMADFSVNFIRGRDFHFNRNERRLGPGFERRAHVLANARSERGIDHQVCPLTETELGERRHGFPRFWTEPNVPERNFSLTGKDRTPSTAKEKRPKPMSMRLMDRVLTALEVAARTGSLEILDLLRAAGADESAWIQPSTTSSNDTDQFKIEGETTPLSALATSSPVHEAISAGQQSLLRHLLSTCRYSPNYRPRAAPTVALPPLSYAIACCDLDNTGVQRCLIDLLSHPQLDANLRTPIFSVHPLHFATARHDPDLLSWLAGFIPGRFAAAGVTALGHTLLHVASLPLTNSHIVAGNPDVARSIHCARSLDSYWRPFHLPSPIHMQFQTPGEMGAKNPQPMTVAEQQAQKATIRVLLEWGGVDVCAKDVDGNTALHYLASTLNVDEETVEMVRQMEGGEAVWQEATNFWGLTPRQLWGE
ncbi:putative ankyrin repeat protein RF_0381 [Aspergillus udagawae]|uniref:Ankyrin repeat protein RF_0381 n=1 Tax=Aspergillus udagawae TaxID=91492 RepID=A0ABQ1BAU4_9EURO|nr:putative ankyrin repeat protein RF_0381 [Aspergillus udagawae]